MLHSSPVHRSEGQISSGARAKPKWEHPLQLHVIDDTIDGCCRAILTAWVTQRHNTLSALTQLSMRKKVEVEQAWYVPGIPVNWAGRV